MSRCTWPETDNSIWNQPESDKEKFHRTGSQRIPTQQNNFCWNTTGNEHENYIWRKFATQPEPEKKFSSTCATLSENNKNYFRRRITRSKSEYSIQTQPNLNTSKLFPSTYTPSRTWKFHLTWNRKQKFYWTATRFLPENYIDDWKFMKILSFHFRRHAI